MAQNAEICGQPTHPSLDPPTHPWTHPPSPPPGGGGGFCLLSNTVYQRGGHGNTWLTLFAFVNPFNV